MQAYRDQELEQSKEDSDVNVGTSTTLPLAEGEQGQEATSLLARLFYANKKLLGRDKSFDFAFSCLR